MASSRIPFRARKVLKREVQQCCGIPPGVEATEKTASSGDGAAHSHKRRKPQQEVETEEILTPNAGDIITTSAGEMLPRSSTQKTLVCGTMTERTPTGDVNQTPMSVEQVTVSITSLSEAESVAAAIKHLKDCDPKLRDVIEASQLPSFQSCTSPFCSLSRSIVYQQLATNAAAAIYKRLLLLCGGESSFTPAAISQLPATELRSIGISARKASYLHDLSRNFLEGGLSDASIMLMEDDKLMSTLTAVKGIGVWSVHMFMIFALHRPDVLPVSDLGVRKGFLKLYGLKALPTPVEMEQLSAPWRPYRSLGAWYMWRLIETKAPVVTAQEKR